tara:strand:+ start:1145 stop:1501 length:357 start_codon:yes stop_codon:yes gene_type:complete
MSKKSELTYEDIKKKVDSFGGLLDSIENIEGKKKQLWKEIYENAFIDRMNAYMLFTDAYTSMGGGINDHIQLGAQLSKYIERMNKANDQLIKLAELISKEEERSSVIDSEDIFKQIQG